MFLGAYRVVCGNGLTVGVDLLHMKRRHSRRLGLPLIKEELSSALERFDEQVEEWRKWADRPLSRGVYAGVTDRMEFGGQARGELEAKMHEEADGQYEVGFPVLSIWAFFNVLTWYITHKAVSVNHRRDMEKIDCRQVEQIHFKLREVAENLALVRDSMRDCDGRWRAALDMADLVLEREIQRLNDLMRGISDGFQGINFRPVTTSK